MRGLAPAAAIAIAHLAIAGSAAAAEPPPYPSEYLVHEGEGFVVAYHPGARERVRALLPQLSQIRNELRAAVGSEVLSEVHVRVVALSLELPRVAPETPDLESGGAFSADQRLVVVSGETSASTGGLERALRHQLAHLALAEASGGAEIPGWFGEGFAVNFSRESRGARLSSIELAVLSGEPPSLSALSSEGTAESSAGDEHRAFAADFARFASLEPERVPALVSSLRGGLPFDRALESAFGARAATIDRSWREDVSRRYAFFPVALLGLLMWLAIFVVGKIRKRRAAAASSERTSTRPRRLRARVIHRRLETRGLEASAARRDGVSVPKVEHDGNWHTLH
ncbi:MAG: hypothetical protein HOV80_14270 [Polyangiaceae bacterium]|nr:hypothetical protein [Polyangiaceae bacterium]